VPVAAAHPERQAARGPRDDAHAGNDPIERKRPKHGQPLPVPPRHLAHGALTLGSTGVGPGHPGVDPALVKEDEALGVQLGQLGPPRVPRPGELGPVLLRRAQALFYAAGPAS
jgi:hypothetical protein